MKPNRLFWLMWVVLMLLNVVTAILMEIHADEAYYHLFGQNLALGYYDHPPMVGLWAAIGDKVGFLRLMPVLMQGVTVWLIWRILTDKRPITSSLVGTFFMVAMGLTMFLTTGFLLTPDAPLMLFVALFFFAYQQYIKGEKPWLWAGVLAVSMAGMMYSKYIGVLVIIFTVASYPHVVRDKRLWCAVGLALILMLPHFYWLYTHDWATVRFHLVARHDGFAWRYLLEYWPNQLLVFNPVALVLMLVVGYKAIQQRRTNRFAAALATTIIGSLLFFWVMSLKGHVEPHWTMAISVPAIVLLASIHYQRWLKITLWVMAGLCLVARGVVCANCLPYQTYLAHKYPVYEQIHQKAGSRVVVVVGSFQDVSLYRLWQGEAILTHDLTTRHTQYELLDIDLAYQGKPALIVNDTNYLEVDQLQLTDRIQIDEIARERTKDSLCTVVQISNPYAVEFNWEHKEMPADLVLAYLQHEQWKYIPCTIEGQPTIAAHEKETYSVKACVKDIDIQQDALVYALHSAVATTAGTNHFLSR